MSAVQDHLDQFYVELQAWIDGGCSEHRIFRRNQPICDQLIDWEERYPDTVGIWELARDQMAGAGLSTYSPFDDSDALDAAMDMGTIYENPARLAWIKEHAEAALARRAAGEVAA